MNLKAPRNSDSSIRRGMVLAFRGLERHWLRRGGSACSLGRQAYPYGTE